eukprot:102311-Pleurochrysis_carterae.AAC.2
MHSRKPLLCKTCFSTPFPARARGIAFVRLYFFRMFSRHQTHLCSGVSPKCLVHAIAEYASTHCCRFACGSLYHSASRCARSYFSVEFEASLRVSVRAWISRCMRACVH